MTRCARLLCVLAILVGLVGCGGAQPTGTVTASRTHTRTTSTVTTSSGGSSSTSSTTAHAGCRLDGSGIYAGPDRSGGCTPGLWISDPAVKQTLAAGEFDPNLTTAHVCSSLYNPRPGVSVSGPLKDQADRLYGEPTSINPTVEADHLYPRWLGGATVIENFWPEPNYAKPSGYNLNPKDKLEFAIDKLTCGTHRLTVPQARLIFEGDWRTAYQKYVGPLTP